MTKCQQCSQSAEVKFSWPTSGGQQNCPLCGACAALWWSKFKSTPSGQGLIIEEVE
jgi:protein-arginine kinase activator protein McsA